MLRCLQSRLFISVSVRRLLFSKKINCQSDLRFARLCRLGSRLKREIYLCTYMLTLCSGLSHYFPDAFSNKYVLPSVTELLKQRSLQHRSIVYSFSSLQEYVELEFCSNERQSPNETQSSPPARSPRTAEAAAAATVGSGGYAGGAGSVAGVDVAFVCMQSSLSKHHQALQKTLGSNI